jgi:LmbE family N-acetylglucosaminyl deacetylase
MSEENLTRVRVAESKKAGAILGVKETIFLGMRYDLTEEINEEQKKKIMGVLEKYKPRAIYFHSLKDGHKDHRAVYYTMEGIIKKLKEKPEKYTYQINLFDFSEKEPKVIVDVSDEFRKKLEALEQFKSQRIWTMPIKFLILLKGIFFGKRHGFKFAEYFYAE